MHPLDTRRIASCRIELGLGTECAQKTEYQYAKTSFHIGKYIII